MAQTEIKDHVIWAKHVHGDADLAARIVAMRPGDLIVLSVDGVTGRWRKMEDGKDGRPTAGLRPIGDAAEHWQSLYRTRRGEVVDLTGGEALRGVAEEATPYRAPLIEKADPVRREAAIKALLDPNRPMGRSTDEVWTRDDMHDRDLERKMWKASFPT